MTSWHISWTPWHVSWTSCHVSWLWIDYNVWDNVLLIGLNHHYFHQRKSLNWPNITRKRGRRSRKRVRNQKCLKCHAVMLVCFHAVLLACCQVMILWCPAVICKMLNVDPLDMLNKFCFHMEAQKCLFVMLSCLDGMMSYVQCLMLILGTCLATFVFTSRLKSECL